MTVRKIGIAQVGDHKAAEPQTWYNNRGNALLNQLMSKYQITNFY